MADLPQAVRRQRRQERDSADPFVERLVGRVGAMTGIVPDHEQARDPQRRHQRREYFHPPGFHEQQTGDRDAQYEPVQQEPDDRRSDAAVDGERLQQFLKLEARLIRRGWRFRLSFRCGSLHSKTPVFSQVDRLTPYYTRVQTIGTEMRQAAIKASSRDQAVSASDQRRAPKCSNATIRAVAASRVLASSRRSWVRSQVRRARRERAEGSLSKSAGKSPRASTNSRIAAVEGAFGAGVSSSLSQVTQRLASPARVIPRLVRRLDSPSARESARLR